MRPDAPARFLWPGPYLVRRPDEVFDGPQLVRGLRGTPGDPSMECEHPLIDGELIDHQLVICTCASCGAQTRQWSEEPMACALRFEADLARAVMD